MDILDLYKHSIGKCGYDYGDLAAVRWCFKLVNCIKTVSENEENWFKVVKIGCKIFKETYNLGIRTPVFNYISFELSSIFLTRYYYVSFVNKSQSLSFSLKNL